MSTRVLGITVPCLISSYEEVNRRFPIADYVQKPVAPGAIEVLEHLCNKVLDENIFFFAMCQRDTRPRIEAWMMHHNIHGRTGIPRKNLLVQSGQRALYVLSRNVQATDVIVHRPNDLSSLERVEHKFLFDSTKDPKDYSPLTQHGVIVVSSWAEIKQQFS